MIKIAVVTGAGSGTAQQVATALASDEWTRSSPAGGARAWRSWRRLTLTSLS